ncbi:hypothetical protein HKCCE4037_01650 [Rhodobacterales bacterium HKCCE4037]|nr:hypothetical protein [Rhodobacterales bacterium HKCCE4037]
MKKTSLAALCALALTAATAQAQDYSAEEVASAILTGFVARDAAQIAAHTNETNAAYFAAILDGSENPEPFWADTRAEAAAGWDGMILPARYDGDDRAYVPFAIEGETSAASLTSGEAGRYMVIALTLDSAEDTSWGFEDINFFDLPRYEGLSAAR